MSSSELYRCWEVILLLLDGSRLAVYIFLNIYCLDKSFSVGLLFHNICFFRKAELINHHESSFPKIHFSDSL